MEFIAVFGKDGEEYQIPRAEWVKQVLPSQIQQAWHDPDALYQVLLLALQDGFALHVLDGARRLCATDADAERGHTMLGIVLLECGKLDEAKTLLTAYLARHRSSGIVLTNLAKVYSAQGDDALAEQTLWEALHADPNQENALGWWAERHQKREGEAGAIGALERAAALPGSWRAHFWLGTYRLQTKEIADALEHFKTVLDLKLDGDTLTNIIVHLGRSGFAKEAIDLTAPLYKAEAHGPDAGINLLRAYVQSGDWRQGEALLRRLYQLKQPDVRKDLEMFSRKFTELRGR